MQDDTSVILFATNVSSTAPRASTFNQFCNRIQQRIKKTNIKNFFNLVTAYTNIEIINQLRENAAKMVVLHFEGQREDYQSLRDACKKSPIGPLSAYLGRQQRLRFIFLSGCATDDFIEDLENAGVPAIIASSYPLSVSQITQFSETVYLQLIAGASLQDAVDKGNKELPIEEGQSQRIFAHLRGEHRAKNQRPLVPHIIGEMLKIENKSTNRQDKSKVSDESTLRTDSGADSAKANNANDTGLPPPNQPPTNQTDAPTSPRSRPPRNWQRPHPFVGNRPFSKADGDIFFGRDSEINHLADLVRDTSKPPFIMLSGQAGCGKTSLIQAGLLVNLKDEFEVIELSGESPPELVSVLRKKLTAKTGRDNLLEAWQTLEGNFDVVNNMTERRILLIIDNIDNIINSPHPRIRHEIRRFLYALLPLYAHSLFRSQSKIIISARSFESKDIRETLLEVAMPTVEMPLIIISSTGLAEAIVMPFVEKSPGNIHMADDTALKIKQDLLRDPTSVQLPFLQAILESLWKIAYNNLGIGATISCSEYDSMYKSCLLFDSFLDAQLNHVKQQLNNKTDTYTLLKILCHHSSPHHLSTQRAMQERHLEFPQLDAQLMLEILNALCDHKLLIAVPANQPGILQIGHRELSPLVRERLIAMNTPVTPWWQKIRNHVSPYFGIDAAGLKNVNQLNSPQGFLGIQKGQSSLNRTDATIILTLLALILACMIAGFLLDKLLD